MEVRPDFAQQNTTFVVSIYACVHTLVHIFFLCIIVIVEDGIEKIVIMEGEETQL